MFNVRKWYIKSLIKKINLNLKIILRIINKNK